MSRRPLYLDTGVVVEVENSMLVSLCSCICWIFNYKAHLKSQWVHTGIPQRLSSSPHAHTEWLKFNYSLPEISAL